MTWVESVSASFSARHEAGAGDEAHRVLQSLERARTELEPLFPKVPAGLTVVLHDGLLGLAFAKPALPLAWLGTAPSARRYIVGADGRHELHMLRPAALRERASGVPGSAAMLERSAACLYTRRVIIASNPQLAAVIGALRLRRQVRWAWLVEGGARYFGGQTAHARPAIARRLREGGRPAFPPGPRDAALLGGTVIDLIAREQGVTAAARFLCRLHPGGPRAALAAVFDGRSVVHTEGAWRSHLSRLAAAQ